MKDIDYKDGKYAHYFEVHSPMGSMRLRAEDAAGKVAWISSLEKQAQVRGHLGFAVDEHGEREKARPREREKARGSRRKGNLRLAAGLRVNL